MRCKSEKTESIVLQLKSMVNLNKFLPFVIVLKILHEYLISILISTKKEMHELHDEIEYVENRPNQRFQAIKKINELSNLTNDLLQIKYRGYYIVEENIDFVKFDVRYEILENLPLEDMATELNVQFYYLLVFLSFALTTIVVVKIVPWMILFITPLINMWVIAFITRKLPILISMSILAMAIFVMATITAVIIAN